MNRHMRRLHMPLNESVSALVDLFHCLPPDTVVVDARMDLCAHEWTVYLVNPEFAEVTENTEVPKLEPICEDRRVGFGWQRFYVGLLDFQTRKEYRPE